MDQPALVRERALALGQPLRCLLEVPTVAVDDRLPHLVQPALDHLDHVHVPVAGRVELGHKPPDTLAGSIGPTHHLADLDAIVDTLGRRRMGKVDQLRWVAGLQRRQPRLHMPFDYVKESVARHGGIAWAGVRFDVVGQLLDKGIELFAPEIIESLSIRLHALFLLS